MSKLEIGSKKLVLALNFHKKKLGQTCSQVKLEYMINYFAASQSLRLLRVLSGTSN